MGGLSVGILSGLLVSGVVLAAVSLSSPLPPRPGAEDAPDLPELDVTVSAEGAEAAVEDVVSEDISPDASPEDDFEDDTPAEATEQDSSAPAPEPEAGDAETGESEAPDAAPEGEGEDTPAAPDPAPEPETEEEAAGRPATEVPLPSGSEFNRPPPEAEAAIPAPDTAPNAAAPAAPQPAGLARAPRFDTTPAAQPDVNATTPGAFVSAPSLGDAPVAPAGQPIVTASGSAPTLNQPATSAAPAIDTAAAPLPEPDEPVADAETTTAEAAPETAAPAVPIAEDETPIATEEIAALDAAEPQAPELQSPRFPTVGGAANPLGEGATNALRLPQASRLPQVGQDESPDATQLEEATVPDADAELAPDNLPAIRAFAAPFDPQEGRPLMAVVLIDEPDSSIDLSTLTRFTFPVAFAIDPLHPDASERAQTYRDAGFEVVMLGSMLPDGATAMDTEVAVSAAQSVLPEAVALLDTPDGRIQGDRPVLDATVGLLAETGHGLLAFPRGLNAAEQTASRAGVPGDTLFRMLDGDNERATVITRHLSRAALTAAQEGTVIVAGHTRPDTVTALFSWALGDRSEAVALAPLSAVLLRGAGE